MERRDECGRTPPGIIIKTYIGNEQLRVLFLLSPTGLSVLHLPSPEIPGGSGNLDRRQVGLLR